MNTNSESSTDLITISRSTLEQALEALECVDLQSLAPDYGSGHYSVARLDGPQVQAAITNLRAALAQQDELVQEKNSASAKLPVPKEWYTELATTCFAKSYKGEGSYYCPHCDTNAGSVWVDHDWRPTKWQAICYNCRNSFNEQG